METSTVVLLSGGQDSTTCFYWALQRYDRVEAISFDYGQRHRVELELAEMHAHDTGRFHAVLPVEALNVLGGASLTNPEIGNIDEREQRNVYADSRGLPQSFVPGRNLTFFTLAAAFALPRGIESIVVGVCGQDRAGYPDCRVEFVDAMQEAIRVGMDAPGFEIVAPLIDKTKAETWALADEMGALSQIVLDTHTCYEGDRSGAPAPWGYGCGECGACVERRRGYEEFRAAQGAEMFPTP